MNLRDSATSMGIAATSMTHRLYQNWFEVWEAESGVFVIQEPFHAENVKSYVIAGHDRAVVIDTGMGVGDFDAVVRDITPLPVSVINSHAHWDHIGSNWRYDEIAIHRHEADALAAGRANADIRRKFRPDVLRAEFPPGETLDSIEIRPSRATRLLDGGERIDLGGRALDVVHAPGHSPGGIVLIDHDRGAMFSTDVVYAGALYAQFEDSNLVDYIDTLMRLEGIAGQMRALYPSHGATPIDPGIIAGMRRAMERVLTGRAPDSVVGDVAQHRFDGFEVFVAAAPVNRAERL